MKIGDLVILRSGRYNFSPNAKVRRGWTDVIGIITNKLDNDGTAEYRVYTVDGKHTWSHVDDLRLVEKP